MSVAEPQVLPISETWPPARCAALLEGLQPGSELQFHTADHTLVSDLGAYIRAQRQGVAVWLRKAVTHGWSTDGRRVTPEALRDDLYRHAQPSGVPLPVTYMHAKEGEE